MYINETLRFRAGNRTLGHQNKQRRVNALITHVLFRVMAMASPSYNSLLCALNMACLRGGAECLEYFFFFLIFLYHYLQ